MTELHMDTGLEEVQLYDELGRLMATIWFNPADMGIVDRAKAAAAELDRRWKNREFSTADGARELEQEVRGLFDQVFACPFSDTVFEHISPLALMADGRCFYECVLDGLLPLVEKSIRAKAEKSHERLQKYLGAH